MGGIGRDRGLWGSGPPFLGPFVRRPAPDATPVPDLIEQLEKDDDGQAAARAAANVPSAPETTAAQQPQAAAPRVRTRTHPEG